MKSSNCARSKPCPPWCSTVVAILCVTSMAFIRLHTPVRNRHGAEPWYGDADSDDLIKKGATPQLEKLVAFFPGFSAPVDITPIVWSSQGDLAVLRIEDSRRVRQ